MFQAWRDWRSRVKLFAPTRSGLSGYFDVALRYEHLAQPNHERRREVTPYEALSEVWDDYARHNSANYVPFLENLARTHHLRVNSVLDLACGTGMLTSRLATKTANVVGLD